MAAATRKGRHGILLDYGILEIPRTMKRKRPAEATEPEAPKKKIVTEEAVAAAHVEAAPPGGLHQWFSFCSLLVFASLQASVSHTMALLRDQLRVAGEAACARAASQKLPASQQQMPGAFPSDDHCLPEARPMEKKKPVLAWPPKVAKRPPPPQRPQLPLYAGPASPVPAQDGQSEREHVSPKAALPKEKPAPPPSIPKIMITPPSPSIEVLARPAPTAPTEQRIPPRPTTKTTERPPAPSVEDMPKEKPKETPIPNPEHPYEIHKRVCDEIFAVDYVTPDEPQYDGELYLMSGGRSGWMEDTDMSGV